MNRCFVTILSVFTLLFTGVFQINSLDAQDSDNEKLFEDFDPDNFDDGSAVIDNEWFPLQPGMMFVYEGSTEEDEELIPHQVITIITDLTKEINGVNTIVIWDRDYSDGELVETEIAFFAQDIEGTVWRLGEHPEEYEDGELIEAPTWIAGQEDALAGIAMYADPQLDTPSYSQGWAPEVEFTDRGRVSEMGQETCVPVDCYEDVLVIEEFNPEEEDSFQLKYFAKGVGLVRVGWRGENEDSHEVLELVETEMLDEDALEEARQAALELEASAYENSQDAYGETAPIVQMADE